MRSPKPYLQQAILEVVENQLSANDPPETAATLQRLMSEGHSEEQARRLIGYVVVVEIFEILKNQKPFDQERFVANLARLPEPPRESQGMS